MSWPLIAGLGLAITGNQLYVVALRLPRASGTPLLVFGTFIGAIGAAMLLVYVIMKFGFRALGLR